MPWFRSHKNYQEENCIKIVLLSSIIVNVQIINIYIYIYYNPVVSFKKFAFYLYFYILANLSLSIIKTLQLI